MNTSKKVSFFKISVFTKVNNKTEIGKQYKNMNGFKTSTYQKEVCIA
jgi:hypothetical protein